jgi:hypothetical protein
MIIFNTTYLVSFDAHDTWLQWISSRLIPSMLATSFFEHPRLFKVLVGEDEGITYSLQFSFSDMKTIQSWLNDHKHLLENELKETFGESVLFFSTFLEELK